MQDVCQADFLHRLLSRRRSIMRGNLEVFRILAPLRQARLVGRC